jgi:hypothetical protein
MSDKINDGGPAFPISIPGCGDNGMHGMSLRDWFAGQAMAAYIMHLGAMQIHASENIDECTAQSYRLADYMLAARSHGTVQTDKGETNG